MHRKEKVLNHSATSPFIVQGPLSISIKGAPNILLSWDDNYQLECRVLEEIVPLSIPPLSTNTHTP